VSRGEDYTQERKQKRGLAKRTGSFSKEKDEEGGPVSHKAPQRIKAVSESQFPGPPAKNAGERKKGGSNGRNTSGSGKGGKVKNVPGGRCCASGEKGQGKGGEKSRGQNRKKKSKGGRVRNKVTTGGEEKRRRAERGPTKTGRQRVETGGERGNRGVHKLSHFSRWKGRPEGVTRGRDSYHSTKSWGTLGRRRIPGPTPLIIALSKARERSRDEKTRAMAKSLTKGSKQNRSRAQ